MTGGFLYLEASLSGVMITGVTNDFFDSWVTGGVIFPKLFSVHFPLTLFLTSFSFCVWKFSP